MQVSSLLRTALITTALSFPAVTLSSLAMAAAIPGQPAPAFSETDASGKTHTLADYKGKWLVLEWFNKDCPYVKKHYGSNNMQTLQSSYGEKGVQWLTVISSAEGKQGYLTPANALKEATSHNLKASAPFLLDVDGDMGRAYDAKTTPHMYIINPEGVVVYAGAIDNNDSANPATIAQATNYVKDALDAALAGQAVKTTSTRAYGCTIKY